jgi:hypothetical protein
MSVDIEIAYVRSEVTVPPIVYEAASSFFADSTQKDSKATAPWDEY